MWTWNYIILCQTIACTWTTFVLDLRRETKELPAIVGELKLNVCWPECWGWLQRPTCRHDQVAQLSQVHVCLCSLGNYGKYYCSLLPLTELGAHTLGTKEPVERQKSPHILAIFALMLLWWKRQTFQTHCGRGTCLHFLKIKNEENSLPWSSCLSCFSLDFSSGHSSPQAGGN